MLPSIFKKKKIPKLQAEQQAVSNLQPIEQEFEDDQSSKQSKTLQPIEQEFEDDQSSKHSKTLYQMPKLFLPKKMFAPDKWNISNFQIGRPLGQDQAPSPYYRPLYGQFYLARERNSKHIVALKVLNKKELINSEVVNKLSREIQIHSHLKHPYILQMYGFFSDESKIYIILEHGTGGELYNILKSVGPFSEPIASKYTAQMISAMKYLHSMNIIHRDLKPENILLCDDNLIKLSDFGQAVHDKSRETLRGTIDYHPPEIILRENYDTTLDMWMIGVLAYELASGRAPFFSSHRCFETWQKIVNLDYQTPNFFSPELKDFVRNILVADPKKRLTDDEALNHPWILKHKDP